MHDSYTVRSGFSTLLKTLTRVEDRSKKYFNTINKNYVSHYYTPYLFQFTSEKQDTMHLVVLPFEWYDDYDNESIVSTGVWYNVYELELDGHNFVKIDDKYCMKLLMKAYRADTIRDKLADYLAWRDELLYVWVINDIHIKSLDDTEWTVEIDFKY